MACVLDKEAAGQLALRNHPLDLAGATDGSSVAGVGSLLVGDPAQ